MVRNASLSQQQLCNGIDNDTEKDDGRTRRNIQPIAHGKTK